MKDLFGKDKPENIATTEMTIIDFGIGKVAYKIEPGCSMYVDELFETLKRAAMSVPVNEIINSITKTTGYPRF